MDSVVFEALSRPARERDEFVEAACAGDAQLRQEVVSLLGRASSASGFLEVPVAPRRLGDYELLSLIGAGGMGEVYRARDTRLGRDVAIKILPIGFAADTERVARLEREARMLAALNHPNIVSIYGLAEADGVIGLVLELVQGETLADRLARGRLTWREAQPIARQILLALEAAHAENIIHRDLKPANISLTPGGVVKVLDFGLAKPMAASPANSTSASTTRAVMGASMPGLILGTAAYMSPEQARGLPVDKRTDVWAFGCVLYELVTGHVAFRGATAVDTIARVLEHDPDWTLLPAGLPVSIIRLLKRSLQRDPDRRLRDVGDARLELESDASDRGSDERRSLERPRARFRGGLAAIAALVVVLAGVAWFVWRAQGASTSGQVTEFAINLYDRVPGAGVAVSPDGRRVAVSEFSSGSFRILIYDFRTSTTTPLPGGERGQYPFWSPDGSMLAFWQRGSVGNVVRTDPSGGPPVTIGASAGFRGGSWSARGQIIFSSARQLLIVPATGGTPTPINVTDGAGPNAERSFPQFLPDGDHFIYFLRGVEDIGSVYLGSTAGGPATRLLDSPYQALYAAPGVLLFIRGTALMAQAFDTKRFALEGEPSLIEANVAPGSLVSSAEFSASTTGAVLAFVPTRVGVPGRLVWFDRNGRPGEAIDQPPDVEYLNPAIAPTGNQVAVNRMDPGTGVWDVWILDRSRSVPFTTGPPSATDPVWSPDGKAIVFATVRGGKAGLYRKSLDDVGPEAAVFTLDDRSQFIFPNDWSPDSQSFLCQWFRDGYWQLYRVSARGDPSPTLVAGGRHAAYDGRFSPDGQWVAFESDEAGVFEIYVQRYPSGRSRTQIARGVHPRWTKNGRELVYWQEPGGLMSVALDLDQSLPVVSVPAPVVSAPVLSLIDGRSHFDVTRDGQRFLVRQPQGPGGAIVRVILNWSEKLGR